jgi:hypothetical protein
MNLGLSDEFFASFSNLFLAFGRIPWIEGREGSALRKVSTYTGYHSAKK